MTWIWIEEKRKTHLGICGYTCISLDPSTLVDIVFSVKIKENFSRETITPPADYQLVAALPLWTLEITPGHITLNIKPTLHPKDTSDLLRWG